MEAQPLKVSLTEEGVIFQWELAPGRYDLAIIGNDIILDLAKQIALQKKNALDLQRSVDLVRSGDMPRNLRKVN